MDIASFFFGLCLFPSLVGFIVVFQRMGWLEEVTTFLKKRREKKMLG
jgi:hypothetical protein